MSVRILAPQGYMDRCGVFHEAGSVAELPTPIEQKLVRHGIAEAVAKPAPKPEPKPPAANPKTRK